MPLQHYLPASFLGRFSLDSSLPARNRSLWACNRFNLKPFPSRANKLAGINNLYAVADQSKDGINIDDIWQKYENKLNTSLDSFIAGDYDAESWLRVLVPFVACLLVRGPDFDKRFARRLGDLSQLASEDNTNHARIMELQRLLGPVCAAKWIIFETKGTENLITNDLGYAPFHYPITNEYGMAIPIGLRHILGIIPCEDRLVLTKKGRMWIPIVEQMPLGEGNHLSLNRAISKYAHNFIFGCDEKIIKKYILKKSKSKLPMDPGMLGFISSRDALAHELTWHRLVSAISFKIYKRKMEEFELDFKEIAKDWCPPVILGVNIPSFPPSLKRDGNGIRVSFYDPEIHFLKQEVSHLEQEGKHKELIKLVNRALKLSDSDETSARFLSLRGAAYDELGEYSRALSDFEASLHLDPSSAITHMNKSITLMKLGDQQEALTGFNHAAKLNQKLPEIYVNRGTTYANVGKYRRGIRDYSKALRLSKDDKHKTLILINRAQAYLAANQPRRALKDFSKAFESTSDDELRSKILSGRSMCYLKMNHPGDALADITKSLEINPNQHINLLQCSAILKDQGKIEDAIIRITEAIKFAPSPNIKARYLNQRGIFYSDMCEYKKGITDFSSALKLTSSDKQILLNRGANYYFIGEFDKSEKDLRKAIEISPDFAEAYNTLGILLMAQGNYADAIPVFEKSIKFAKSLEKAMPLRNISLSYIALGELPKAEKLIAEAKKIDPRNKFLFHVLGRYHYALGDFEKSLDFYNTAESASDIPGEFALEKSLALIRNGFFDEGLSYINLALSDDPNHLSLKDLLKELQSLSIMETSPRLADCISIIQEYISSN